MKHFINPLDSYGRNYQLIPTYIEDCATYLHLQTGDPLEQCREYVRRNIGPGGRFELRIPEALVLVRDPKTGDRRPSQMPLDHFLQTVRERRQILSPSMTAYMHPDDRKSLLADYISGNLQLRKKAKHAMFEAKMKGDEVATAIYNSMQTTYKIKNNSLSGAHCSPYTILWNKSSHSTLTSTCRTATSYANANNEKFLYGNRHYYAPDIVKTNLISIINHSDLPRMEAVMTQFGLRHPTVEQVMACIHRCTEPYWRSPAQMRLIQNLVEALSPIQRSAFLFTSDFYHLAQVNPEFVRQFLTDMSVKASEPLPMEDADHWIKQADDNLKAFVNMLCVKELAGGTLTNADGKDNPLRNVRPDDYGRYGATVKKVIETLDRYEPFIRAFWVTDNLPSSVYYVPNIIRRGAITSDTDSTIFTVQYWTEWYVGKLDFSEQSVAVASTMVYFAGQLIRHILATFSGNMGVAKQDITRLSMKNEYYFPVFVLTSRAKHYYAYIAAQEGNVYKELDTEIKGVALRNSNVPPYITKQAHALMKRCMDKVMAGEKIKIFEVMAEIAEIENGIRRSIESGSYELMPRLQIKSANSYKDPANSNYLHYDMWESVFAEKYGHAPEPPYTAVKANIDAGNPTKLAAWLDSMEDQAIANKMRTWLKKTNRRAVSVLILPEIVLSMTGVPKEIVKGVDVRGLIFQTMEAFYLILESLGIYLRNDNITRLVSDQNWKIERHLSPDGN